jgi:hypothetical protein
LNVKKSLLADFQNSLLERWCTPKKSNIPAARQAVDSHSFWPTCLLHQPISQLSNASRPISGFFAHTRLDAISVVGALLHCAYFFGMFYLFPAFRFGGSDLRLFEIARVLVRVNHVARFIINADHGIM